MHSSDSVDHGEKVTQPNSLHLVSCGDFEIGWRSGLGGFWWVGQYLRKKHQRNANRAAAACSPKCLIKEMEKLALKCQLLPDPSKWDPAMHTWPFPSFSDEPSVL